MPWTSFQYILVIILVISSICNIVVTKWAAMTMSIGSDGVLRRFHHPFYQALITFFAMILCLVAFKVLFKYYSRQEGNLEDVKMLTRGTRQFNPFILAIPAACDVLGLPLLMLALNLTYASSFTMLLGVLLVFVTLLSVVFLDRTLYLREWTGIGLVLLGITIVGFSDYLSEKENEYHTDDVLAGDILIIFAQIIMAVELVVEEKFVRGLDIPALQAVGLEGVFGFFMLTPLVLLFYFIKVGWPFTTQPTGRLEDVVDMLVQLKNSTTLIATQVILVISIAVVNWASISIVKELSATTRVVLGGIKTVIIWMFSLAFFGQEFQWIQLIGFIFLVTGMCVYNNAFEELRGEIWERCLIIVDHIFKTYYSRRVIDSDSVIS